jgi:hypothetical protein
MTDLRKAAQAVVERWDTPSWKDVPATAIYIEALRQALAHQTLDELAAESQRLGLYDDPVNISQEGVDETAKHKHEYVLDCPRCGHCCPERKWVGLTDEEKAWCGAPTLQETVARVEAKLKEKNRAD